jgi:hypothetical protein
MRRDKASQQDAGTLVDIRNAKDDAEKAAAKPLNAAVGSRTK